MSECPEGWKLRCVTPAEYEHLQKTMLGAKTMDSAKKSVEKILEIANKHGYSCVVGLYKNDQIKPIDKYVGVTGSVEDIKYFRNYIDDAIVHYNGVKDGE